MKSIMIIDDDVYISDMLTELLSKEGGYQTKCAYSGTEALLLFETYTPDLVILDLMLPGISGEKVLEKIKNVPVIVLSAKIDIESKVNLLLGGAVDYITKPFNTKELLARITVALRKAEEKNDSVLAHGKLKLDTTMRTLKMDETEIHLTRTEYAIMKLLMLNPMQVVTKSQMLDKISADTPDCTENSLKIHISNLRKKLREVNMENCIEAVWGIGYKIGSV